MLLKAVVGDLRPQFYQTVCQSKQSGQLVFTVPCYHAKHFWDTDSLSHQSSLLQSLYLACLTHIVSSLGPLCGFVSANHLDAEK